MTTVTHVVMSDLHLGAGYSLLTDADESGNARPQAPSPTLVSLAAGFRSLLPRVCGEQRPTLVLLGDVYDLSFAAPGSATAAFERLIEEFWSQPPIFADTIVYVPGNHDHRMWQLMRDAEFLESVRRGDRQPDELVVTGIRSESMVTCELATALAQRATGNPDVRVVSGYPNIGIEADGNVVVMHHGHYTEGTYRVMSKIAEAVGGHRAASDLRTTEMLNGPWIDFGWSSSGDEGQIGPQLYRYYEMMQDPAATHTSIQHLATKLIEKASSILPIRASTRIDVHGFDVSVQGITEALLDITLDRAAQTERGSVINVLSPDAVEGVRSYIAGPVRSQLAEARWAGRLIEGAPHADRRLSFVFGHTHKPFQDDFLVPGYAQPVQVWNTGGWVLDHPGSSPTQGGAAILVDDAANVASLRLFNDPIDGSVGNVRAAGCPDDPHNPLVVALAAAVADDPHAWDAFSRDCLAGIDHRAEILRAASFDPTAHPPARARPRRSVR